MKHRARRAIPSATAVLGAILWLGSGCTGGIMLGVSAAPDDGGASDAGVDGATPGQGDASSSDGGEDTTSSDGAGDATPLAEATDSPGEDSPTDLHDASPSTDAGDATPDGGGADAPALFDASDASPDAYGNEASTLDAPAPCGDVTEPCCAGACNGAGLACSVGVCVQVGVGDQGVRCSTAAACQGDLCLPIGGGSSACTTVCSATSDCLSGWTCNPIGGQVAKACQCTATGETCDGKDNDCNGIIDDVSSADPWCAGNYGNGFVCRNGSCSCGYVCGSACVTLDNDPANCGACGNACATGEACQGGTCDHYTAIALASGSGFACVILADHTVACWGENGSGQLGNGLSTDSSVLVPVLNLTGPVAAVVCSDGGPLSACALLSDGTVECWGDNSQGELGNGTTSSASGAVAVSGLTGATAISVGQGSACALSGGRVECWGQGGGGLLGNGMTTNSSTPVQVQGLTGVVAIGVGATHACALLSGGTVECWGYNSVGQLGNGGTTYSTVPVSVSGLSGVTAIAVGYWHTCAMLTGGTVECWGSNAGGTLGNSQLGTGPTGGPQPYSSTPVTVSGLTGATAISADNQTCALMPGGTVECWGYGPLGNGTGDTASYAVNPVSGLTSAVAVSAGSPSCALLSGGTVECWGNTPAPVLF